MCFYKKTEVLVLQRTDCPCLSVSARFLVLPSVVLDSTGSLIFHSHLLIGELIVGEVLLSQKHGERTKRDMTYKVSFPIYLVYQKYFLYKIYQRINSSDPIDESLETENKL